jgi:spore maturation protein CgeB
MKIIFCCWESLCEDSIIDAFAALGHESVIFHKEGSDNDYDMDCFQKLVELLKATGDADFVFSVNYIPIVARACKPFKVPYLSLTMDCPCNTLYSNTLAYPHNKVFLFDRLQTEKFYNINPGNIFYSPLACDVDKWDNAVPDALEHQKYDCDISFVGSLYSERCPYDNVEGKLSDYMRGYVDGLIAAQQNVYGYDFLEDSITNEWAQQFKKEAELSSVQEDYTEDITGVVADLYLGHKCTEQERINTIAEVSEHFNMDIYTRSDTSKLPHVHNKGIADSETMMPRIFKCSKINLNMTSTGIRSGIPLRVFDVMGCGGFLISNYQPEIPEYFVPDEDIVLYDSIPDLLEKIEFYLEHEDLRLKIAANGYEKVKKHHTWTIRMKEILDQVF